VDKYFIDKRGKAEERIEGMAGTKNVHFPLCLAIKYEDNVPFECIDFLLNTSKGRLFAQMDNLLPLGSPVLVHFYIPPETKLLAEFKGKVVEIQDEEGKARGIVIKLRDFFHIRLKKLEEILEEKRHIVDEEA